MELFRNIENHLSLFAQSVKRVFYYRRLFFYLKGKGENSTYDKIGDKDGYKRTTYLIKYSEKG